MHFSRMKLLFFIASIAYSRLQMGNAYHFWCICVCILGEQCSKHMNNKMYLWWVAAGKRRVRTQNHWSLIPLLNYLYWKYNYSLNSYFFLSNYLSLLSSLFLFFFLCMRELCVSTIGHCCWCYFEFTPWISHLPLILFLFPRVFNEYHFAHHKERISIASFARNPKLKFVHENAIPLQWQLPSLQQQQYIEIIQTTM